MSKESDIDKFLLENNFGKPKISKIQRIYNEVGIDEYNFSQKSGIEFEINCLGDVNFKKYIESIYNRIELIEIFRNIKERGYNNSNPKHQREINALKDYLENNPIKYKEFEKKLENRVKAKVIYIMNNKKQLFPLINKDGLEEITEIVENCQRRERNISNPATRFANDLHASLMSALDIKNSNDLEFYSSTKTHLDSFAIDAWFKYKYLDKNNNNKSVRVFFDLTAKTEAQKMIEYDIKRQNGGEVLSDLVLSMPGKENYNRDEDKNYINLFTKRIKEEIEKKISAP